MTVEIPDFLPAFTSRSKPALSAVFTPDMVEADSLLRARYSDLSPSTLSVDDVTSVFEGNLWSLAGPVFLYFLPAFMRLCLVDYPALTVFAGELIGALTEPSRQDVSAAFELLDSLPPKSLRNPGLTNELRSRQLEWFDSGAPNALFVARFDDVLPAEGAAIVIFLERFRRAHSDDFPFDEIDLAMTRHWYRYRP